MSMRIFIKLIKLGLFLTTALGVMMLFSYDIVKVEWMSFMESQPSFRSMEHPLPVPVNSIPVEGAAYIPGTGSPSNPIQADAVSIARGKELFNINCSMCHGTEGKGNGPISNFIVNKPANLTGVKVVNFVDGEIFLTISNGVKGKMPALNENLTVRERWDVVNFIRWLQQQVK